MGPNNETNRDSTYHLTMIGTMFSKCNQWHENIVWLALLGECRTELFYILERKLTGRMATIFTYVCTWEGILNQTTHAGVDLMALWCGLYAKPKKIPFSAILRLITHPPTHSRQCRIFFFWRPLTRRGLQRSGLWVHRIRMIVILSPGTLDSC